MKKVLSAILAITVLLSTAACGDRPSNNSEPSGPPDLSGQWKQVNSTDADSYQGAIISGDKMEIYWVSNGGDTRSLYWAGSFDAPDTGDEPYSWDSQNDTEKTNGSMLASGDSTKTFTYADGQITYSASIMGSTTKVRLERTEWEPGLKIANDATPTASVMPPTASVSDDLDCFPFTVAGIEFSIPGYYEKSDNGTDSVTYFYGGSNEFAMLMFYVDNAAIDMTQAEYNEIRYDFAEGVLSGMMKGDGYENWKLFETKNISIDDLLGFSYSLSVEYEGMDMEMRAFVTYNENSHSVVVLACVNLGVTKYDFFADYDKILETAKLTTPITSTIAPASGIRPEFKTAMDSYEDFFDEYIAFMQSFSNSDNALSMLSDYMNYMEQYTETMEAMEALDDGSLSQEEAAYYLEVSTRITQKLLKATQ